MNIHLPFRRLLAALTCGALMSACGAGSNSASSTAVEQASSVATAQAATMAAESTPAISSAESSSSDPSMATDELVSLYQRTCISCHLTGAANAPKTHDVNAWAPRLAKGNDVLVKSVREGLNGMPPMGMCFDCSDEQYTALIDFMAGPKP